MKKDIFNFRRFGKYFMSDAKTCTANYGLALIAIPILALSIIYVFSIVFGLLMGEAWSGPDTGLRFIVFIFVVFCIVITMPVKCYGKVTEKLYGSQWLMIPASKLEKSISMIILSCIVAPIIGSLVYIGLDALLCAVDHTCGKNIISGMVRFESMIGKAIQESTANLNSAEYKVVANFIEQLANPWLYIDDFIQIALPFLLGAVCFKSGKTVKTFLALAAASTALSIITTPVMIEWSKGLMTLVDSGNATEFMFNHWFFRNIALVDTVSDTVANIALITAIYFRIKTLKH